MREAPQVYAARARRSSEVDTGPLLIDDTLQKVLFDVERNRNKAAPAFHMRGESFGQLVSTCVDKG